MVFEPDPRSGEYLFFADTWPACGGSRIGVGRRRARRAASRASTWACCRGVRQLFGPFLTFVSLVPPLAILPILFIALGVDELAKVALIFLGVFPLIARDMLLATEQIPQEQLIKALTLGASRTAASSIAWCMPQVMPRLIDTVRLALGAAWLFLIAAEAIASTEGLGYRIFLVRRYLAMDVILPYVAWITLLGFASDWLLQAMAAAALPLVPLVTGVTP